MGKPTRTAVAPIYVDIGDADLKARYDRLLFLERRSKADDLRTHVQGRVTSYEAEHGPLDAQPIAA